jgi:hypothetical protein
VKSQKKKDKSTPCFEKHAIGPRQYENFMIKVKDTYLKTS